MLGSCDLLVMPSRHCWVLLTYIWIPDIISRGQLGMLAASITVYALVQSIGTEYIHCLDLMGGNN